MDVKDKIFKDYGLVSVITPAWNCGKFIDKTIQSIQSQTYQNWEMLITDDCSSDNTTAIIQSYSERDSRIKLFRLEKNGGAGVARNNGIKESSGRYIAFCDSDDVWLPDKLEKQLKLMHEKDAGCVYGAYYECNVDGDRESIMKVKPVLSYRREVLINSIGMSTGLYDTKKMGKIYMPLIRKRQDWALWIAVLKKCGKAYAVVEPVVEYRIQPGGISRNKFDLIKYHVAIYQDVVGMPKAIAFFFTLFVNIPLHTLKKLETTKL